MDNGALLDWGDVGLELIGFIASFLAAGAVGFQFGVMRRAWRAEIGGDEEKSILGGADARAARLGFAGAFVTLAIFCALSLPEIAARQKINIAQLLHTAPALVQTILVLAAFVGFTLAVVRVSSGWTLAALAVVGGGLRPLFFGQWLRAVNPVHRLAAGLWVGTLLVLVVAGVGPVLRSGIPSERRGAIVASMVNAFSPLALCSAGVLAVAGVITAWRHLKYLAALWTTPYGYALIAKLIAVAIVVSLGAWNWRRQRPQLGTEVAARSLQLSATAELVVAAIVAVITAILVSLPSPKLP